MSPVKNPAATAFRRPSRWTALGAIYRQPKGAIGLTLVICYALLALFGPMIAPIDPLAQDFAATLQGPTMQHWFGTDQLGRDVLSRILTGARTSIGIGIGGVLLAFVIGVPLGVLSAWKGGWIESLVMRAMDVLLSFPDIIFALAVVAIFGASTQNIIIAVGLISVPVFARSTRAITQSTLAEPYIEGSVSLGCPPLRVVLRHVMPNISGPLLTLSSLLFASTLLSASGLGFLGLGVQPPDPEWGTMLGEARSYIRSNPSLLAFPGVFLALSALAFNLLGEALRTIYDPLSKRIPSRPSLLKQLIGKGKNGPLTPSSIPHPAHVVEVKDLQIAFRTPKGLLDVVRGVDLTLERGKTLAVVGESGSGKSTLLRVIGTLINPGEVSIVAGKVDIDGQPTQGLSNQAIRALRREKIGIVFQDAASALNPVMTIGAQLAEAVKTVEKLTRVQIRQRCIALLRDVEISDPEKRLDMYPHQFSGGMKQRIVIAIALAQNPAVLLADEPTSALDVTIQQQLLLLLRKIQQQRGMAILLVTHDLNLVARYADSVAIMYAGRLVETGAVETVFRQPLHPYSQALRACTPHAGENGAERLTTISGEPPSIGPLVEGCAFLSRCQRSRGRSACAASVPPARMLLARQVACVFAEEASHV
ncbi:dipeptide/oligopeptide/nickel ABC transporter permease/ATP-binding protein [Rouxiella sp. T17]|uniref:dipeptide/oligopeptide/nickel ABC transporter permease/ATP-binding protein n=1 Tax=Rouxiella sp. T17 TaxID=3085684 RepID=UPI002FC6D05F